MAQTAKKETKKLVTAEAEVEEAVLDDEKMELLENVETEDDVFAKEETVKNGWDDD